jgi:3-hydroxyacyl-[acyl-carrier-protein] dehydratase
VFVDRILRLDPGDAIEVVRNVSATEDVFDDHFPGVPLLPGALLVEAFEQATQLLVAVTHDFKRVGRLHRVSRASFRHFVRPGDQVIVGCRRRDRDERRWTVAAMASVGGQPVATAVLGLDIVGDEPDHADRLRRLHETLTLDPLRLAEMEEHG